VGEISGMPITVCEALSFWPHSKTRSSSDTTKSFLTVKFNLFIAGHHGLYGDRPTTVAATIIHYIDMLESQTTENYPRAKQHAGKTESGIPISVFLYDIPLAEKRIKDQQQKGIAPANTSKPERSFFEIQTPFGDVFYLPVAIAIYLHQFLERIK